ncbi:MAG: OmpA family protein [Spirochaetia bacterium]|nr:OmpA family protein [Spirochaetia bacterium]
MAGFDRSSFSQESGQIPATPIDEAEILNLGANINTSFTEYTPFITPDEHLLFFESDRPGGIGETGSFDLWYSINATPGKKIPSFSLPINLGIPVNSPGFDGLPSLRRLNDGTYEMYFTSYADNGRGGPLESNIYYTRQVGKSWSTPIPVAGVNSDFHDRMPSISPDGKFLFFSSDRPGGFGKDDIWVSQYDDANKLWKPPLNPGDTINTPDSEISPSIHTDGITLYFSSDRRGGVGGYDIYITQRLNGGIWKKPGNLGTPYNTEQDDEYPTVTNSGEYMYFTSNRPGSTGGFDIFRARVPDFARPSLMIPFSGNVYEQNTTKGIEATISIHGDERHFDISSGLPDGNFKIDFINNKIYEMLISAPGYEPLKYTLDLRKKHDVTAIRNRFFLKKSQASIDSYNLLIQFSDEFGKPVAARAVFRFQPDDAYMKKIENNTIVLKVPPKITSWNSFLERNDINITAEADGFEVKEVTLSMKTLMENGTKKGNNIIIPIEMKREGSSEEKTEDGTENGRLVLIETIYFDTDIADRITQKEKEKIVKILSAIKKPGLIVELHGHTDKIGSLEKNIKLSMSRSNYIKQLMTDLGIPAETMRTYGHNYSRPAVKETDEASRKKNRRVEIFIKAPARQGEIQ